MTYTYPVDGRLITGHSFVPGPFKKLAEIKLPKSAWLREDGLLKFEPNADVDVFYNPRNPEDAVLIPGIQPGLWSATFGLAFLVPAFLLLIFLIVIFSVGRERLIGGTFFFLFGLVMFWQIISYWRRSQTLRRFKSTTGRLLSATVVHGNDSDDSHRDYHPCVSYEYEVDGRRCHSTQWSSILMFATGCTQSEAYAQINLLQAEPRLTVYYDPICPSDAFLRQESAGWAIFVTGVLVLWGISAALFIF